MGGIGTVTSMFMMYQSIHFKFTTFSFPGRRGIHFLSPLRLPERGIGGGFATHIFLLQTIIYRTNEYWRGSSPFISAPVTGDFTGFTVFIRCKETKENNRVSV